MSHSTKTPPIGLLAAPILALILAAALQLGWALIAAWGYEIVESTARQSERVYEGLAIRSDGMPLLVRDHYRGHLHLGRREVTTLDGEAVERESQVYGADFAGPKAARDESLGRDWVSRLQAYAVQKEPGEFWYFVHDGQLDGLGYFEGFGAESSRPLGFIGRSGYRADRPPIEDRFRVTPGSLLYSHYRSWPFGSEPWDQFRRVETGRRDRTAYVVARDQVWQVNLSRRTVETIWRGAGAVDIEPIVQLSADAREPRDSEAEGHWGLRTLDRLELLNIDKQPAYSVPIPEAIREETFQAYERPGGGVLFVANNRDPYDPHASLYWVSKGGAIEKSREVTLRPNLQRTPESLMWAGVGALIPGSLTLTTAGVIKAWGEVLEGHEPSIGGSLAKRFAALWPTLLVVILLGAALAVLALRRQERFGLGSGVGWAIFVFLFGPAGLLGYLWQRHWAVRGICPSCGAIVPLDREKCLRCGNEFPRPARLGTEIRA
jgi:hypothetical protein